MADFTLVEPKGWEYDLHSIYSAYLGYFQVYNIAWYERSWGHLFESFEAFLAFSWPVITVTDATTGRAHIVTRLTSVHAFLRMIKTRFGETLPQAPNTMQVTPFESASRHLRHVADYAAYKKLHATLPAVVLSATKQRVRAGAPGLGVIKDMWERRDKTYLALGFEWNERNERTVLEWGYAAVRCAHLEALAQWPPIPDTNYRKGHYIVAEHADKITNKHRPNYPWQFGESQVVPKAKLPQIIQAVISSLASPDAETAPNTLVLVGHNLQGGTLARLEEMKIKLPHNMLIIDTMVYERALYANGHRGVMQDPIATTIANANTKGPDNLKPRVNGSSLSFENLLWSLTLPDVAGAGSSGDKDREKEKDKQQHQQQQQPLLVLPQYAPHNAGNDAVMCLFALQRLLEPAGTLVPTVKQQHAKAAGKGHSHKPAAGMPMPMMMGMGMGMGSGVPMVPMAAMPMPMSMPMMGMNMSLNVPGAMGMGAAGVPFPQGTARAQAKSRPTTVYDLASEFGQMQTQTGASRVPNPGSYGYSSTSLRPPLGSASKRMHSFPNPKIDHDHEGLE